MRVAVADDSALFREGLVLLLRHAGIEVTVAAGTAEELLAAVDADPPDAVILDIRMPPTFTDEGVRAAERLCATYPGVGVVVLSTYAETPHVVRLLGDGFGGVGYLLKDRVDDVDTLLDALRRVASGRLVVDEQIVAPLLAHRRRASALARLTDRERTVLRHMAEGRSNQGIGAALHLAPKTVENHVASLLAKLDLPIAADDNRRVLAVLAWLRAQADVDPAADPPAGPPPASPR
ncbi:response regulator transcription factor [Pseudofrankia sp. BMG5.37]|uniref:response regulator transcription factor n=1 Tax=Pseudofrankia sp. BMG5.37 TaxID=3050035 RepID=UPI002894D265|nr:response regulator transcription factor [Pseudofrankia sp. BMG5.37]MDT3444999.1 response regulator transcription factor [Pseudofrankia sp. BMG5.37]